MFTKRSWVSTFLAVVLMGTFLVISACGSPAAPSPAAPAANAAPAKAPEAKAPAKPAPAAKAEEKAKPAPAPASAADKGEQLVANFNFKEWDNQTPHRWIAEPADKVGKSAGADKNSVYAELKPSGTDKPTLLRQRLSANLAGKPVTLTLRTKCTDPKMFSGKLSFETKAGIQTVALDAEGDGKWESLTKTVNIPADAKPGSATFTIVLRPGAKNPALVDYVMVKAQ